MNKKKLVLIVSITIILISIIATVLYVEYQKNEEIRQQEKAYTDAMKRLDKPNQKYYIMLGELSSGLEGAIDAECYEDGECLGEPRDNIVRTSSAANYVLLNYEETMYVDLDAIQNRINAHNLLTPYSFNYTAEECVEIVKSNNTQEREEFEEFFDQLQDAYDASYSDGNTIELSAYGFYTHSLYDIYTKQTGNKFMNKDYYDLNAEERTGLIKYFLENPVEEIEALANNLESLDYNEYFDEKNYIVIMGAAKEKRDMLMQ